MKLAIPKLLLLQFTIVPSSHVHDLIILLLKRVCLILTDPDPFKKLRSRSIKKIWTGFVLKIRVRLKKFGSRSVKLGSDPLKKIRITVTDILSPILPCTHSSNSSAKQGVSVVGVSHRYGFGSVKKKLPDPDPFFSRHSETDSFVKIVSDNVFLGPF